MLALASLPAVTYVADAAATASSLVRYWGWILPLVRNELAHWSRLARAIPDPVLRQHAVDTLSAERLNAEAAAVFATLAPRRSWPVLVPLLVAFEVMFDYLDTITEQPAADPLRNACHLHLALIAALDPELVVDDYYALHPQRADGGYLAALVDRCRAALPELPGWTAVKPFARRAAERCGLGQSHTHAAIHTGDSILARWALNQHQAGDYRWWELAAGAISSVSVFALLAAATDARISADEAARIDAAYFPPIAALSALLDSFVDRDVDLASDAPSSFAHYETAASSAERIGVIATRSISAARALRNGRRHAAIVRGIAAYYLSASDERAPGNQLVARGLRDALGPTLLPILATMRVRRRLRRPPRDPQAPPLAA